MAVIDEISKAFTKQADRYERCATVQYEIGLRLLERLQYLKMKPQYILDLGCGPGHFSRELALMYPRARIVGLDSAQAMVRLAKKKQSFRCKWSLVAGTMQHMPFASGLFDLVFANQVLHWGQPLEQVIRELNRIIKVDGCLMFTTLGPDTFKELNLCFANHHAHSNSFADMHDVGDILLNEFFLDPVMDMEWLTVHYQSVSQLVHSLKNQGVRNIHPARNPGLTGKKAWSTLEQNYNSIRTSDGKYPLTYEVVYGHAWKGQQQKTASGTETFIPLSSIKTK